MMRRLKNKGFALVELIIAIAILSVMGGGVTSLVVMAQNNYTNSSAETNLQEESQLLANTLHDLMIGAAYGLSYEYSKENAKGNTRFEIPFGASYNNKVYIYDQNEFYGIYYKDNKLYYRAYPKSEIDSHGGADDSGALLAENVKIFSVDLSNMKSSSIVKFDLELEDPATHKTYKSNHQVKLRNDSTNSAAPVVEVVEPDSFILRPEEFFIWPGANEYLYPILKRGGLPVIAPGTIAYTYEGKNSDATCVVNGQLQLALEERGDASATPANSIKIKATYSKKNGDKIEAAPITAKVRVITGIGTSDNGNTSSTITTAPGTEHTSTLSIHGVNIDDLTFEQKGGVEVTVTEGEDLLDGAATLSGNQLNFKIKDDVESGNIKFRLSIKKDGFTNIEREVTYIVEGTGNASWKRGGTADIFINIPDNLLCFGCTYNTSEGSKTHGTEKIHLKGYTGELTLHFTSIDKWGYRNDNAVIHIGNQGQYNFDKISQDAQYSVKFYASDVRKATIEFERIGWHGTSVFSSPYATSNDEQKDFVRWPDIAQVEVKATLSGLNSAENGVVASYDLGVVVLADIQDVAFKYTTASPEENNWYSDTQKIYITKEDASHDYLCNFFLYKGWNESNTYYILDESRFSSHLLTDSGLKNLLDYTRINQYYIDDNKRQEEAGITVSHTDNENKITISVADRIFDFPNLIGKDIKVIYEYNKYTDGELNALSDLTKNRFAQMDGCEGNVSLCLRNANVKLENSGEKLLGMYCPTINELNGSNGYTGQALADGSYAYYTKETERYVVSADGQKAKYQYKIGGAWITKHSMKYDFFRMQWIENASSVNSMPKKSDLSGMPTGEYSQYISGNVCEYNLNSGMARVLVTDDYILAEYQEKEGDNWVTKSMFKNIDTTSSDSGAWQEIEIPKPEYILKEEINKDLNDGYVNGVQETLKKLEPGTLLAITCTGENPVVKYGMNLNSGNTGDLQSTFCDGKVAYISYEDIISKCGELKNINGAWIAYTNIKEISIVEERATKYKVVSGTITTVREE